MFRKNGFHHEGVRPRQGFRSLSLILLLLSSGAVLEGCGYKEAQAGRRKEPTPVHYNKLLERPAGAEPVDTNPAIFEGEVHVPFGVNPKNHFVNADGKIELLPKGAPGCPEGEILAEERIQDDPVAEFLGTDPRDADFSCMPFEQIETNE